MEVFEAQQISIFCDIVCGILCEYKDLSIIKLSFFAYALNKNRFFQKDIYSAKNKKSLLEKEISTISGDFDGFANALPMILKAIHVLKVSGIVTVESDIVHFEELSFELVNDNLKSKFVCNAIEESKKWSDKRFVKEVLHNV